MAEALAVGASVITILQTADRIIDMCKFYISTMRDAPSDLRAILFEASTLKIILKNLKFLGKCKGNVSAVINDLCGADGPVEGCLRSVQKLEELFPPDHLHLQLQKRSKKQKIKSTLTSLAWPLKQTKARKLLDDIVRYKSTITLALTTESFQDIKDTKAKALMTLNMLTGTAFVSLIALKCIDGSIIPILLPFTIELEGTMSPEQVIGYYALLNGWGGLKRKFVVSGFMGYRAQPGVTYVYYYCYFARNQDEADPFLKWLLSQLCRKANQVPAILSEFHKHGGEPSRADLLDALASILTSFKMICVVVDAIDESTPREDLLTVLHSFATESSFSKLQILASSREYDDIERTMTKFSVPVSMNNPQVEVDIRRRVQSILQSCPQFGRWPNELLHEVEEAVVKGAEGMFRWAVCQLDVLKRLKCERHVVMRALKNLPKTLEETYDRIFAMILEEERLFVHLVLRWIAQHNEMYDGKGMPCEVLIQAAVTSTIELTGEHDDRFYDQDTLREICGCLIYMSPEKVHIRGYGTYHYVRVAFAHYTVREYLDSGRISRSAYAYCSAVEGTLKERIIGITMLEVQNTQANSLGSRALASHPIGLLEPIKRFNSSFPDYCVVSSINSLYKWPDIICRQNVLRRTAVDLLDPSKPHFETMMMAAALNEHYSQLTNDTEEHVRFWHMTWYPETNLEAKHLYILLVLYESRLEYAPLIKSFLQGKKCKSLLEGQLGFETYDNCSLSYREISLRGCELAFNGSLLEIFAQRLAAFPNAFNLLMEVGIGSCDLSVILLMSITGHRHKAVSCQQSCLILRLLELGANPNMEGYLVTPLQIATYCLDLEGVRLLLQHSAHPNSTGCSDGVAWGENTLMGLVDHLHGASPLRICRKYRFIADHDIAAKESIEKARDNIERLLLQHGAEEISSTYKAALNEDGRYQCKMKEEKLADSQEIVKACHQYSEQDRKKRKIDLLAD